MSLPDISFEEIRPTDRSRDAGFEEMCCQLASLEPASSEESFYRKGRGGDAGVECYRRRADGTEVGWQAKYLFHCNDSLKTQLDHSIRRALDKHPQLVEYVVCLPFDLSNSRTSGRKTAREKWDAWCAKWKKFAASRKRNLRITLWGKSELSTRLAREDPAYSGRLLYWFGHETLTTAWFKEQFGKARESLGSRYTPETNVELPIRQDFLSFARHPDLQKSLVARIGTQTEFSLSQAVASGDAFEHRPSERGHCVQDFSAELDLRDLPGEAAGFEFGADDALPTAHLRFYSAALVVPCCRLPGHAPVAADLGNMAIPNGRITRRLQADHCVLWRRYDHIQGLPIPLPQQISCGRSIVGAVSQKARDRGIQLIQEAG